MYVLNACGSSFMFVQIDHLSCINTYFHFSVHDVSELHSPVLLIDQPCRVHHRINKCRFHRHPVVQFYHHWFSSQCSNRAHPLLSVQIPQIPKIQPSYASATANAMTATGPGLPYGSGASDHPAGHRSLSRGRQRSRDRQSHARPTSLLATPPAGGRRMGPREKKIGML